MDRCSGDRPGPGPSVVSAESRDFRNFFPAWNGLERRDRISCGVFFFLFCGFFLFFWLVISFGFSFGFGFAFPLCFFLDV